ncbi:MAG TPA: phosphatase PAP2 family protein [Acidothermaceae bacterium]|nr:phosphatase PAP2 family protein [Acidothermaceae bacterium]
MARRPLLARRGLAVVVVIGAALATVALGVRYGHTRTPGRVDRHLDAAIQRRLAGHPHLVVRVVDLADPGSIIVICALLCALFLLLNRTRLAVLAIVGPGLAGGLVDFVLKPLFDRHLETMLSFPSGHTAATASLALVVLCAMIGPGRLQWPFLIRWLIAVAATAAVPIMAIALVGGGYHYATDTIGGLLVAIACVLSVALVIDTIAGQPGGYRPAHKKAMPSDATQTDDAIRPRVRA